jgi:hypothetical protein
MKSDSPGVLSGNVVEGTGGPEIGTPIALIFIAQALLFLPSILGITSLTAGNPGASNETTLKTIESDLQHLGTEIVGIIHHHAGDGFQF